MNAEQIRMRCLELALGRYPDGMPTSISEVLDIAGQLADFVFEDDRSALRRREMPLDKRNPVVLQDGDY